ncbi:hypothetical protein FB451DRAFT_1175857 [Mycena latifolia]|nr:hypothetical protein FB451DRAFT_1175857 [Mycena latifolia]
MRWSGCHLRKSMGKTAQEAVQKLEGMGGRVIEVRALETESKEPKADAIISGNFRVRPSSESSRQMSTAPLMPDGKKEQLGFLTSLLFVPIPPLYELSDFLSQQKFSGAYLSVRATNPSECRMDAPSKSIVGDGELNYRAANYIDSLYAPEEYDKATAVKQPTRKRVHTFQQELAGLGTARPERSKNDLVPPSGDVQFNLGAPPSLLRLVDLYSPSITSMDGEPSVAGSSTPDTTQPEVQSTAAPAPSLIPSAMGAQNTEAYRQEDEDEAEEDSEEEGSMACLLPTAYTCAHCHIHTDASRRSRSHRSKLLNGAIICGVCSVYERMHRRLRPLAPVSAAHPTATKSTPRKPEVEQCSKCGRTWSQSAKGKQRSWSKSKFGTKERICGACYVYEWKYNRPRPQEVIARAQTRRRSKK